jgi:hypothetical protein
MPASQPENLVNSDQLPPLAAEDHVCDFCAVVYPKTRIDDAVSVIVGIPGAVRDAVCAIPPEVRRVRPSPKRVVGYRICLPSARRVRRLHHPAAPRPHRESARLGTNVQRFAGSSLPGPCASGCRKWRKFNEERSQAYSTACATSRPSTPELRLVTVLRRELGRLAARCRR